MDYKYQSYYDNAKNQKSLWEAIVALARYVYPEWLNGNVFEQLAFEMGKKGSNASRRLREMELGKRGSGNNVKYFPPILKVQPNPIGVHSVEYQYIPRGMEAMSPAEKSDFILQQSLQ